MDWSVEKAIWITFGVTVLVPLIAKPLTALFFDELPRRYRRWNNRSAAGSLREFSEKETLGIAGGADTGSKIYHLAYRLGVRFARNGRLGSILRHRP